MFTSKSIGAAVRHTTAAFLLGGLALTATAGPADAQALYGGGKISANAECFLATNYARVGVHVQNPARFSSTGLVYYTQLWAKGRWESRWNFISQAQSPVINTWTNNGGILINMPKQVFLGTFTGAYNGTYDIYIQYWYRVPTSSGWTGPYGFNVSLDPDSVISTISNDGFGNLASRTSDCNL